MTDQQDKQETNQGADGAPNDCFTSEISGGNAGLLPQSTSPDGGSNAGVLGQSVSSPPRPDSAMESDAAPAKDAPEQGDQGQAVHPLQAPYLPPFRYDAEGQYIWANGDQEVGPQMAADIRGWGALIGRIGLDQAEAHVRQDAFGEWVADTLNAAAAPAQADTGGWRPIETAPKDGAEVIVFGPLRDGSGSYYEFCKYSPANKAWPTEWMVNCLPPTHWMPRPTPPQAGEEDARGSFDVGAYCRSEVQAFALLMEERLRANDHKPGWKAEDPWSLVVRLREETQELQDAAICNRDSPQFLTVGAEAADVANFAMMIADVCGGLRQNAERLRAEKADREEALTRLAELGQEYDAAPGESAADAAGPAQSNRTEAAAMALEAAKRCALQMQPDRTRLNEVARYIAMAERALGIPVSNPTVPEPPALFVRGQEGE